MALVIRSTRCEDCPEGAECATRREDRFHCRLGLEDDSVTAVDVDVLAFQDAFGEQRKAGTRIQPRRPR